MAIKSCPGMIETARYINNDIGARWHIVNPEDKPFAFLKFNVEDVLFYARFWEGDNHLICMDKNVLPHSGKFCNVDEFSNLLNEMLFDHRATEAFIESLG